MSVDISWDTVTGGPDGEVLAEKIRGFVHEKFQQIQLPRFIKSVQVHSFAFGSACPSVTIKDVPNRCLRSMKMTKTMTQEPRTPLPVLMHTRFVIEIPSQLH